MILVLPGEVSLEGGAGAILFETLVIDLWDPLAFHSATLVSQQEITGYLGPWVHCHQYADDSQFCLSSAFNSKEAVLIISF